MAGIIQKGNLVLRSDFLIDTDHFIQILEIRQRFMISREKNHDHLDAFFFGILRYCYQIMAALLCNLDSDTLRLLFLEIIKVISPWRIHREISVLAWRLTALSNRIMIINSKKSTQGRQDKISVKDRESIKRNILLFAYII